MRKIVGYLFLLYLLLILGAVLYSRLAPPPPPEPPSAWDVTWREHGNIVAFATIAMLTMIELAIGIFVLGGVLVLLKKGWTIWANSVGRSGGLAPVLREKDGWYDPNPDGAVIAAAIAAHAPRVTASMAGHMMGAALGRGKWSVQDATYTDAPPLLDAPYEVVEEWRPDMVNATGHGAQHHIFVGPTGSGKSVAAYSVLDEMKRQQPDTQFYIFEPGGVEWKQQAAATSFDDLFELVRYFHEEMRRRQQILAAHPEAVHAFQLGLSPVVLFIEEAGAALDYFKLSPGGKKLANEFLLYLRNLLREGRKTGIIVVLVDQSAMAETVDTQVLDNVPNVLLMVKGASPKLLRRWGLTDEFRRLQQAGLLQDRPGLAYSYHRRRLVQFPKRERPVLMLEPPKLDGFAGRRSRTIQTPSSPSPSQIGPASRPSRGASQNVRYVLPPTRRPDGTLNDDGVRADRQNVISEATARRVYAAYKKAGSYNGAQQALFPDRATGGYWFYWIRDIVEQMEGRKRSRPTVRIVKSRKNATPQQQAFHRSAPSDATLRSLRNLAEQGIAEIPYPMARELYRLYEQAGSVTSLHGLLWPGKAIDRRRANWLNDVIAQIAQGRPDENADVRITGWPRR